MGAAPPVGDGDADGGENHCEAVVFLHQVVIVVAGADGNRWHVFTNSHFFLKLGSLDLFL